MSRAIRVRPRLVQPVVRLPGPLAVIGLILFGVAFIAFWAIVAIVVFLIWVVTILGVAVWHFAQKRRPTGQISYMPRHVWRGL